MLSSFRRVHLYLYHSGFVMDGTAVLRENVWCKTSQILSIRGRIDIQYSRSELKELTFKKKRIFLPSDIRYLRLLRYNFLQTCRLCINKGVPTSILVSTEKNHWVKTWCCEKCQIFEIASGDFQRYSIYVWWDVLTERWIILWRWNNRFKWKQWAL